MKERPILFSSPMVRAILEGRKTQTRRIVKARSFICDVEDVPFKMTEDCSQPIPCPYGQPGDRLWVRESFARQWDGKYIFKADYPKGYGADKTATGNWKPSIHMPREASRILLEVTAVTVERLLEHQEQDAIAEGVYWSDRYAGYVTDEKGQNFHASSPQVSYLRLWASINGQESVDENPWVWVIEFIRK